MKEDTKQKLIMAGAEIMHLKGFNNTGIQEILDKAGIPKGSFYNFFKSKEDFGLQVIDYFVGFFSQISSQFFGDKSQPPLERIQLLLSWFMEFFRSTDYTLGCPIGNFAQEMGDISPAFREKLKTSLDAMSDQFEIILREARELGHLSQSMDIHDTAHFIISSWEGALMLMKVAKSTEPLETHTRFLFDYILKV
jgi:TetR/AcrR family transcriptional regulator, transcriptional repressor for nem operon